MLVLSVLQPWSQPGQSQPHHRPCSLPDPGGHPGRLHMLLTLGDPCSAFVDLGQSSSFLWLPLMIPYLPVSSARQPNVPLPCWHRTTRTNIFVTNWWLLLSLLLALDSPCDLVTLLVIVDAGQFSTLIWQHLLCRLEVLDTKDITLIYSITGWPLGRWKLQYHQ